MASLDSCCKALNACAGVYIHCHDTALLGRNLLFFMSGNYNYKNSSDLLQFPKWPELFAFILYFQCVLYVFECFLRSLCLFKKEPSVAFLRDLFHAIHCWVLFSQLDLSMKDQVTFVIFNNSWYASISDAFYSCVLSPMYVLFLFRVFRFAVDIRSPNSTLTDLIFHGWILKLFRFNKERILLFSQNCSYFYSCSGLVFLNI